MKFIDLFCGIGGFHLALAERGHECVFASDIDKHCREVYKANFGLEPADDITKVAAGDIPAHDILCGGFPCQPFSLANKSAKGMNEARGTLFFDIARIVEHHRPRIVLLENVPRIITFDGGNVKRVIDKTFDDLGYRVAWHKLNAAEYGAATARRRAYIVAVREDAGLVSRPPSPTGLTDCIANHLRHDIDTSHLERDIKDYVFYEHPSIASNPQGTLLAGRHKDAGRAEGPQGRRVYDPGGAHPTLMTDSHEQVLAAPRGCEPLKVAHHQSQDPKTQGYRVYGAQGPAPTFVCKEAGHHGHTEAVLAPKKVGHLEDGNGGHSGTTGKRLFDVSGPAPTFLAWDASRTESYLVPEPKRVGVHGEKGDMQGYRVYAPEGPAPTRGAESGGELPGGGVVVKGVVRRLHIEEAKTIQGFPAGHVLSKGNRAFKQIGNSVIPRMVGVVFDAIEPLREQEGILAPAELF